MFVIFSLTGAKIYFLKQLQRNVTEGEKGPEIPVTLAISFNCK
jgi:hypothetical protein